MNGGEDLVQRVYEVIVQPVIYFLFGVGIVVFIWGLIELIWGAGSEDARRKGKQHIMWGLIGLTIMASVFGITSFIFESLPEGPEGKAEPPINLEE